jgi:hypothetical protein
MTQRHRQPRGSSSLRTQQIELFRCPHLSMMLDPNLADTKLTVAPKWQCRLETQTWLIWRRTPWHIPF